MKNPDDRQRFSAMMFMLAEIFKESLSEPRIDVYWDILEEYPIDDILKAAKMILQTKTIKVFPLPAEFISVIDQPDIKALDAWQSILKAIEYHGIYQSPTFKDPLVSNVIQSFGGWISFCMMSREQSEDQWNWTRKEFMKIYQSLNRSIEKRPPMKLIGLHEQHNELHAPALTAPQKIGEIGFDDDSQRVRGAANV